MPITSSGSPDEPNLREAFRAVARGDRDAFSFVYDELSTRTYSACSLHLSDPDERDAAMIRLWLHIWRLADRISRSTRPVDEFIDSVATRFAADIARRNLAAAS